LPTENEMRELFRNDGILIPPLSLRLIQENIASRNRIFDAEVEISWMDKKARFLVELKSKSTPLIFRDALNYLKSSPLPEHYLPMLIMPYLSELKLSELEQLGVSGIDLCGNYLIVVPGEFAAFRSGAGNRFPSSAPIKNIYRKNSSMVGRVFLAKPRYSSVQEVCAEINRRNLLVTAGIKKPISLSTVSKSLKTLENDLIIGRERGIDLLQAEKLLTKLTEAYFPPKAQAITKIKLPYSKNEIFSLLLKQSQKLKIPIAATGTTSFNLYAVMERGDLLSVYCTDLAALLESLPGNKTDRFPNLELIETNDERVFFDPFVFEGFPWASPVQVYLELMDGDKRDQETATQIKSFILDNYQKEFNQ